MTSFEDICIPSSALSMTMKAGHSVCYRSEKSREIYMTELNAHDASWNAGTDFYSNNDLTYLYNSIIQHNFPLNKATIPNLAARNSEILH